MKKAFIQKLLSLGLAMVLGLSLTACSGGSSSATADSTGSSASEAESSESASSAAAESQEAASESVAEETAGESTGAAETESTEATAASGESDLAAIQEKGTLVVGITNFEPMDYQDEHGDWIGFDADLATQFAEYLGVEVAFSETPWEYKVMELEAGKIY